MGVEVNIREGFPPSRTVGLRPLLLRVGTGILKHERVPEQTLSILLTNDEEMRALNREWRGKKRTTDVLSFEGDHEILGDVVISLDQAERQAKRHGVDREEEIARLLIHGALHLLGYFHDVDEARWAMEERTEEILRDVL